MINHKFFTGHFLTTLLVNQSISALHSRPARHPSAKCQIQENPVFPSARLLCETPSYCQSLFCPTYEKTSRLHSLPVFRLLQDLSRLLQESQSPVTSSLQSLYNMKHILAYTSSFVKSRLHIDQPQILHRSFFNDSSCKSINIRFAFPTSPASVCQMSNSGKPGIPIGTSSLRNSILLSVTFLPDI